MKLISFCAGMVFFLSGCSNMLFFPTRDHLINPANHGIKYENIYINTADNQKIHAWLLPPQDTAKGTLLFLHGNGENISTQIGVVHWLPRFGYRVILIDYRGYGMSDGKATLDGSIEDIEASIEYTVNNFSEELPVIVMGQSIGASMTIYALAKSSTKQSVAGLVLISPFSDYQRITRETLSKSWLTWLFQYPLSWTISNEYDPAAFIKEIAPVPVYFIHGSSDNIVTEDHSRILYDLASSPKKRYLIPGGHNDMAATDKFRETLLEILQDIVSHSTIQIPHQHG